MKIRRSGVSMLFATFDDWHRCLVAQLENGIDKTNSLQLREKLQDALVALREIDECFHTVTVTHAVPVGISAEYLAGKLRETFCDDELTYVGPGNVAVTVSSRGTIDYVRTHVCMELERAIKRAILELHPLFP